MTDALLFVRPELSVLPVTPAHVAGTLVGAAATLAGVSLRPRRTELLSTRAACRRPLDRRTFRLIAIGGLVAVAISVGVLPTLVAASTLFLVSRVRRLSRARADSNARHRRFPDALDLVIIGIRAGLTPRRAVEAVADVDGPCRPAFAEVVRRTSRGEPFADAVRAVEQLLGPWAASSVDAIASCDRYGLPLEGLLDQLNADARAERLRLDLADARRLPVKLSFPLVACTLPSFVLLAIVPAVIAALSSLHVPTLHVLTSHITSHVAAR